MATPMTCTYPMVDRFASAATPKLCGGKASLPTSVPYISDLTGVEYKDQVLCLKHSVEVATWKLVQEQLEEEPPQDNA